MQGSLRSVTLLNFGGHGTQKEHMQVARDYAKVIEPISMIASLEKSNLFKTPAIQDLLIGQAS